LAKDDAMKRAVVEKAYQLEIKKLGEERATREAQQAEERLKVQAEEMRAAVEMDYERQAFDLQHLQRTKTIWESFKGGLWFSSEETDRQLEELQLRYEKEYELAQGNLERQNELVRRFAVERTSIERAQAEAQRQIVASVVQEYGKGVAEAAVGFAIFGDNFKEATAAVLDGLAKQSGVRALMEVAEGLGALAFGSPSAGAHFASAAKFAVAAALAGGASAAAGGRAFGGAGGKKNNADSTSPSGSPQTSATPARATATQSQIVYNVNFGGAVVYDTKRAAEMALTQRIDRRRGEMRGAR
jgi:hypothetical protein